MRAVSYTHLDVYKRQGHDAVGAEIVATVHDGQPGAELALAPDGDVLHDHRALGGVQQHTLVLLQLLGDELRQGVDAVHAEHEVHIGVCLLYTSQLDRIQRTANAVAKLDVLTALAQVAAENNYCRPVVDDSDELTITEGRHPVVEQVLKGSLFVPNDTTLNLSLIHISYFSMSVKDGFPTGKRHGIKY